MLNAIPALAALIVLPFVLAPEMLRGIVAGWTKFVVIAVCLGALALAVLFVIRLAGGSRGVHREIEPDPASAARPKPGLGERLRTIDWYQFEKVVAWAYAGTGYDVTRRGGANPDGGIDLVIARDGQQTAVQCKQWQRWQAGVRTVREFLGAMKDQGFERGLLVTLNPPTREAERFAHRQGIRIVTEEILLEMLRPHDGASELEGLLDDQRKVCPRCESEMVLRTSRKEGTYFWGCSEYPRCKQTLRLAACSP